MQYSRLFSFSPMPPAKSVGGFSCLQPSVNSKAANLENIAVRLMLDKNSTITNPLSGLPQSGFIVKVLAISAGVAVLIKIGGPMLAIPATSAIALTIVLLPTVIMAITLGWRYVITANQH